MARLRKYSFIVAILGIFILFLYFFLSPSMVVGSSSDFNGTIANQKVVASGVVTSVGTFGAQEKITLDSGIEGLCSDCSVLMGKNVTIFGRTDEIYGKWYVQIYSYSINNRK